MDALLLLLHESERAANGRRHGLQLCRTHVGPSEREPQSSMAKPC